MDNFDKKAYTKNVQVITEFVSRLIFDLGSDQIYTPQSEIVSENLLNQELEFFSSHSTFLPDVKVGSETAAEVFRLFKNSVGNVKEKAIKLTGVQYFQEDASYTIKFLDRESIYTDLVLFCLIGGYLGLLFLYFNGKNKVKTA